MGYTKLDLEKHKIREFLNVPNVVNKIRNVHNWLKHLQKTSNCTVPLQTI
jgi:hypothetical protein